MTTGGSIVDMCNPCPRTLLLPMSPTAHRNARRVMRVLLHKGGTRMARTQLPPITLTDDERETLHGWLRRHSTAQALAQRARVVLECATGKSNATVCRTLRLDRNTVGKWRRRFLHKRVDGLLDEPRPGAPRTVSDAQVE